MVFILGTAVEAHTNFDGGAHAHRCLSEPTFNNIIISLSFVIYHTRACPCINRTRHREFGLIGVLGLIKVRVVGTLK